MDIETSLGLVFGVGYFALIALIARSKNRRIWVWLLFAVIMPGLALLIILFAYPLEKDGKHESGVS